MEKFLKTFKVFLLQIVNKFLVDLPCPLLCNVCPICPKYYDIANCITLNILHLIKNNVRK